MGMGVGTRARQAFGAVLAAALMATALAGIWVAEPTAVGAAECPVPPAAGHWTGSAFSNVTFTTYSLDSQVSYSANGGISGTVLINGGGPYALSGSFDCAGNISFGTVTPISTFTGTISPDGRSDSGTYTAAGDNGTWSSAADPYVLTATSTVQPTTISPGGASSWVIDVENSGTAAATLVDATFSLSGSGTFGNLSETSVTQGSGCALVTGVMHCGLGTILPGATASATVKVDSTGGGGSSIVASGAAASTVGGGTDDSAPPVTISVVSPATLPAGTASGVAHPGEKFATAGGKKATPANPIVVVFKLPKRVALGTTHVALSHAARTGKASRSIDGVSLMALTKHAPGKKAKRATGSALGLPKIASVAGPSVPMSISRTATEASTFCGGSACSGDVINMTPFSGYNDRKHPAKVVITWDQAHAGRGVHSVIFKRGDARTSPTQTLGICQKTKLGYTNTPCVSKKKIVSGGAVQFTLLVLSGDPKFGRR